MMLQPAFFYCCAERAARFAGKFTRLESAWVVTADEEFDSTSH
jgi:hypothetical protein